MYKKLITESLLPVLIFMMAGNVCFGQFPPIAGEEGSTAIHKDSSVFVSWATTCQINRGWQNIDNESLGYADSGSEADGQGIADGMVVSLGDGGEALLTFENPIVNGPGYDFAVFENAFIATFLELAFVEVSSNGVDFYRFPAVSNTPTTIQIGSFGAVQATNIHNLAGKYMASYGTPFDLEELKNEAGLDVNSISHIKIIDVVGSINDLYTSYDSQGNKVNDPWPTPFPQSGFDLDAVGVINQTVTGLNTVTMLNIKVGPNPVTDGKLTIQNKDNIKAEITILNTNGEKVLETALDPGLMNVLLSHLDAGIYFYSIQTEKGLEKGKLVLR